MRRVLILQHEPDHGLTQWLPLFKRLGVAPRFADFSRKPKARPGLAGIDGLIVLGGGMNVHEVGKRKHLAHEMTLVRKAAAKRVPVLGICLGSQLAAKALGGKVMKSRKPEIGWFRLSKGFGRLPVFQWHEYEFSLPKGAEPLAASPACPNQGFKLGTVTAVQFHPEVDRATIKAWLSGSPRKVKILKETTKFLPASRRLGRRMFTAFLRSV